MNLNSSEVVLITKQRLSLRNIVLLLNVDIYRCLKFNQMTALKKKTVGNFIFKLLFLFYDLGKIKKC